MSTTPYADRARERARHEHSRNNLRAWLDGANDPPPITNPWHPDYHDDDGEGLEHQATEHQPALW